ncbi:MAG: hypothetical protein IT423_06295 [Pirellulaceae bacterium]|nr:hypothetical protein [Pirellulaceae bacterium]
MHSTSSSWPVSYLTLVTLVGLFTAGGTLGCAKAAPVLIPAKGTISIKGKPAANISLQFLPDVKEGTACVFPSSTAISSADGSFELSTVDSQPGAVPGPHLVVLADLDEERPAQGKERTRPVRLDSRYSIAGSLKVSIEEGKPIVIDIR